VAATGESLEQQIHMPGRERAHDEHQELIRARRVPFTSSDDLFNDAVRDHRCTGSEPEQEPKHIRRDGTTGRYKMASAETSIRSIPPMSTGLRRPEVIRNYPRIGSDHQPSGTIRPRSTAWA